MTLPFPTSWVAFAAVFALSLGHWWWRRAKAREIAEQWLAQHRYRVRSLRVSYWNARPRFRMTPFHNNDWAVDFRAEVDDMRLGGTGTVRLRVWTDWLGLIDREPEISWDRMPTEDDGGARAPESQWLDAQIALLRRVAEGETTFRPEGHDPKHEPGSIRPSNTCSPCTDAGSSRARPRWPSFAPTHSIRPLPT